MNTNGTAFAVLKDFTGSDGAAPYVGLTVSGSVLFGTTTAGGTNGSGTIFKVNTDGTGFVVLKDCDSIPKGLALSGSTLYGTSSGGGAQDSGTVFKLNTDGTGYTVLKSFSLTTHDPS